MKRLIHLLLLITWVVGAVTGGLTVHTDAPSTRATAVVADTDRSVLRVRGDQIVMAVRVENDWWRLSTPVPGFVASWLRDVVNPTSPARRGSPQHASLIPI